MKDIFARITKVEERTRTVYGRAVQEVVDKANEVFDYQSSKPNFQQWSAQISNDTGGQSLGNVRAMHGNTCAGKLTDIQFDDVEKAIDVAAQIVDDNEWKKVKEGCYTGFSIGGKYTNTWADTVGTQTVRRYTAMPSEISLVDAPCVPTAKFFEIRKRDGSTGRVAFQSVQTAEGSTMYTPNPGADLEGRRSFVKAVRDTHRGARQALDSLFGPVAKSEASPQRASAALVDRLAKMGIGIKATSGVEVEEHPTQARNGVWSDSVSAIQKCLATASARETSSGGYFYKATWNDGTRVALSAAPESYNASNDNVRADDGVMLASDAQRADALQGLRTPKPAQIAPPHSSYIQNMNAGPQDSDAAVDAFKAFLTPDKAKRMTGSGFQE